MSIIFKDKNLGVITRVDEGHAISYHNRILLNPEGVFKEGESVMLFTKENLEDWQSYYDKIIDYAVDAARESMETVKESRSMIEFLTAENQRLKEINQELTLELSRLK